MLRRLYWKGALWLLNALTWGRSRGPIRLRRVAVFRPGLIGDVLLCEPLIAALSAHGVQQIDLVVASASRVPPTLFANFSCVRIVEFPIEDRGSWRRPSSPRILVATARLWFRWSVSPDVLVLAAEIESEASVAHSALLGLCAHGRSTVVGFAMDSSSAIRRFLDVSVPTPDPFLHESARLLLLADAIGVSSTRSYPRLNPQGNADALEKWSGPTVVFQVGASTWTKAWPTERLACLAKALGAHGVRIVLVGKLTEARAIGTSLGTNVVDLLGKTDLQALLAVLESATVVVANDSFPMHAAIALRRPTIGLIGPGAAKYFTYPSGEITILRKKLECSPPSGLECVHYLDCVHANCMAEISVEDVLAEILSKVRLTRGV